MCVVRGGHFWQFTSLATETTDWEVLVPFLAKHGLRSDLRAPNLKNFYGGAYPQTPLPCFLFYFFGKKILMQVAYGLTGYLKS